MKKYFIFINDEVEGPFELEAIKKQPIEPETLVCFQFEETWQRAADIPEIAALFNKKPQKPTDKQIITQENTDRIVSKTVLQTEPLKPKSNINLKQVTIVAAVVAALAAGRLGVTSYQTRQDEQAKKRRALFVQDSINTVKQIIQFKRDSLTTARNKLTVEKMDLDKNLVMAEAKVKQTTEILDKANVERADIARFRVLRNPAQKRRDLETADAKIKEIADQLQAFETSKTTMQTRINEIIELQLQIDNELARL